MKERKNTCDKKIKRIDLDKEDYVCLHKRGEKVSVDIHFLEDDRVFVTVYNSKDSEVSVFKEEKVKIREIGLRTEKTVRGEKKSTEKAMILLEWDRKVGKHMRYILNPSLRGDTDSEAYYHKGMRLGFGDC